MIKLKRRPKRFWNEVPALAFVGSLLILTPIFAYITVDNIRSQERNTETLLTEKCTALIRSFEASTRSGIMEGPGDIRQLQKLLYETAQQPDIEYLLVADTNGTIIAHSNYRYEGVMLSLTNNNKKMDLSKIADSNYLYKQVVVTPEGKRIFVVFKRFSPTGSPLPGSIINYFTNFLNKQTILNFTPPEKIIVVALDMSSADAGRKIYFKNAIVTGVTLLLTGITGIILLFMLQGYRSTRSTLSKITVFSNTLVENIPVGLIAMDSQQNIMSLNHKAKSILSITGNDETINYEERLPLEIRQIMSSLGKGQEIPEHEIECTMPDGRCLPLEINAAILRDYENALSGTICLFKDLSTERALKHEVERSRRLATVGKLAAGVAHEVRNPLSSIKGFATYFKERYRDIPEDQQISDIMIQEVDRLNRVVSQLLEFARPVSLALQNIPVRPFIENSLKLVERKAQECRVEIRLHFDEAVDTCFFDPDKIRQVLLNLYLNAIDAMENGGVLSVAVSDSWIRSSLIIQVCDTGTGIVSQNMEHIFDPYFTTKSSGTGLGLAISHNIIESHKGDITIESKPGEGTTISISLPLPTIKDNDEQ